MNFFEQNFSVQALQAQQIESRACLCSQHETRPIRDCQRTVNQYNTSYFQKSANSQPNNATQENIKYTHEL